MTPSPVSEPDDQCIYAVRLPWATYWTDDFEHAYQLATGEQSQNGGDDHPDEDRITVLGLSAREVECVHCSTLVSESLIERHHTAEHPLKRWNPAWYADEVRVW
jgi:hypothetical protein